MKNTKHQAEAAPVKAGNDKFTIQGEPRRAPQPLGDAGATCPTANGADLDRWEVLKASNRALLEALMACVDGLTSKQYDTTASRGKRADIIKAARAAIKEAV